jgi:hypothetical protein
MSAQRSGGDPSESDSFTYRYARNAREQANPQTNQAGPHAATGARSSPHGPAQTAGTAAEPSGAAPGGAQRPGDEQAKVIAEGHTLQQRERRNRDRLTLVVAFIALCQVLGTADVIPWTPGVFLHGGLERLVHWGAGEGYAAAGWAGKAGQVVFSIYWVVLTLACSRLAAEAVPMGRFPVERSYLLAQRRVAYLAPLLVLLAGHAIGAWIAANVHWLLAIPFELGGHMGMAVLLYLFLVPEARRALVIVVDLAQNGLNNRVHFTGRVRTTDRRWASVTHHHLRMVTARSPLLARLLGSAHLEFTYIDASNNLRSEVLKYMDSKAMVAYWAAFLNGAFHTNNAMLYTLPPNYQVPGVPPGKE